MTTLTIHFGPFIPEQIEELRHLLERVELQLCEMADVKQRLEAISPPMRAQVFSFSSGVIA